jgi:hypothetical protein
MIINKFICLLIWWIIENNLWLGGHLHNNIGINKPPNWFTFQMLIRENNVTKCHGINTKMNCNTLTQIIMGP